MRIIILLFVLITAFRFVPAFAQTPTTTSIHINKTSSDFWSLYFIYCAIIDWIEYPATFALSSEILLYISNNLYLFYIFTYFFDGLSRPNRNVVKWWLFLGASILAYFVFKHFFNSKVYPLLDTWSGVEPEKISLKESIVRGIIWIVHYFIFAAGYYYFQSSIQKQKDLLKATEEKAAKEKEAAELENKALRAQINPHFLFNTLGYFYNEVSNLHPQVGDGIAALSDIMRSAIRKPDADGLIPLEEEINNIEQLISIYELRYGQNVHISFTQEGDTGRLRILPHILNTLVENAFKHGELHNADHPLMINLKITDDGIQFSVSDKKRNGPKELSHGIGMTYIQTHLNSFYKDHYTMDINDEGDFYAVSLKLNFQDIKATNLVSA